MNQDQSQNNQSPPLTRFRLMDIASIKHLISFDVNVFLSIIIGTLATIILFASSVIFYLYLYKPVFTSPAPGAFLKPSVNKELLDNIKERARIQQATLSTPLVITYPDPFTRP